MVGCPLGQAATPLKGDEGMGGAGKGGGGSSGGEWVNGGSVRGFLGGGGIAATEGTVQMGLLA